MLLMGLNIGLLASTIFSVWANHCIPGILAVSCGAVGGVTVYSRVKASKTGASKRLYDLVQDDEEAAKKLKMIDFMFWALGGSNTAICLWYGFNWHMSR